MKKFNLFKNIASFFKMVFSSIFGSKKDKIRNKNLLKRGGYAIALVAIVVAVAIVLNVLVGLLAKRVNLEYDLTVEKKNSVSEENREYLKTVSKPVEIYILASSASEYYGGYMQYYAQQLGYSAETNDYYKQTTALLEIYDELNDNITVKYVDISGVEMAELNTKYPESYYYGDILVTSSFTSEGGVELKNHKLLTFGDIYNYSDITGGAAYGYDYYYISGSILETALTSAIASVTSEDTKKVAFLSGHGGSETYGYYKGLLELNNFIVDEIDDEVITAIPAEYDAIVICAPKSDFLGAELDAINDFLDNGGYKGKTLLYFGDSGYQKLPNLYDFMSEWGIEFSEGVVFEGNPYYRITNSNSTLVSVGVDATTGITPAGGSFVSGYNVPMRENGEPYSGRETTTIIKPAGLTVIAPLGTDSSWEPPEDSEVVTLASLIMAKEADFKDNKAVTSYVLAFSSVDFISESYVASYGSKVDYDGLMLRALKIPTGMNSTTITFAQKKIASTSSLYITSEAGAKTVLIIFTAVIPLAILAFATFIFIRRRNL